MTMPLNKEQLVAVVPALHVPKANHKTAEYLEKLKATLSKIAGVVFPPLGVLAVLLLLWQILASRHGSGLPPPTQVFTDSSKLILHPFYDNGGTDKGLGFHILASLSRVAIGYSIAAVVGIALGTLVGSSKLFMRGFDPIFQILRTVPPLAWLPISLAAFRDGQPSAIFVILSPPCGQSLSIQPLAFAIFHKIIATWPAFSISTHWNILPKLWCPQQRLIFSPACALALAFHGWQLLPQKC